jgi:hypothetical protein
MIFVDRDKSLENLKKMLARVKPAFQGDEAAYEHMAEIQSVIDCIVAEQTDEGIWRAADWVGLSSYMVTAEVSSRNIVSISLHVQGAGAINLAVTFEHANRVHSRYLFFQPNELDVAIQELMKFRGMKVDRDSVLYAAV